MTEAETILKLIETVAPDNGSELIFIDAYTFCFLTQQKFIGLWNRADGVFIVTKENGLIGPIPSYTRSRDALKAIRPEGWIKVSVYTNPYGCDAWISNGMIAKQVEGLSKEELAELHAIIQAIAHDRKPQGDTN